MARILGIDPGSNITGYGVIETTGSHSHYVDCGCIRAPSGEALAERLKVIYLAINELIKTHQPDQVAVEQVFMHRYADAALKLGQARGVVLCALAVNGLTVNEYAPRAIKLAVVGHGGASKEQVQHMICALLKLNKRPQSDAADALAIALCHTHTQQTLQRTGQHADLLLNALGRGRF